MADSRTTELKTISNGEVPHCRMENAGGVQDLVRRLLLSDEKRSKKRAAVDGLVDGNAPLSSAKLREANRADAANFNDGSGRGFLESGAGALYDLSSEAPGVVQIQTGHGNDEQRVEWSREMSAQADIMFARDKSWDSQVQTSQNETVLHGTGPYFFENTHVVLPKCIQSGDLLVPSKTVTDLDRWEVAAIPFDYHPPELYVHIQNEAAAKNVGWDVKHTKLVIEHAVDANSAREQKQSWEYYQNQLKTNSLDTVETTKVCKLVHVFWKEFNGRVTHVIIERADTSGVETKYLFKSVGRYDNFYQVVNPMYFDKGRGGLHHNVTGLGVKMFGMMSYKNRLFLNLLDKAFAPKILFKPTSAEAATKFELARFGDYGLLPPGTDAVQVPIQGFLTDGLAMYRTSDEMLRSNLSQYRQQVAPEKPGNPLTALEVRMRSSQQSSLSNTVFARYYKQLDLLYAEIVRRLCNLNSTDQRAIDFQERCRERGVPKECFGRIETVTAVRVLGQGSPFMRQEAVTALSSVIGRCSEEGQNNWLNDFISAHAGQSAVGRYNPRTKMSQLASDQKERATNQIANAKIGIPPTISGSQNPMIFAALFIQAGTEAVMSVKKGADSMGVLAFLSLIGPGIVAHLKRMGGDKMRQPAVEMLSNQAERLEKITQQLRKQVQAQQQKRKQQGKKTQQVLSDTQLKQVETQAKISDKMVKTKAGLADKAIRTRQALAIQDAKAASEIALAHARERGAVGSEE